MGCSCHGDRKAYEASVKAYDQCLACARKHVVQAWQLWHEFMHEMDNRDMCSAELRACASHCKYIAEDIAVECRDTAKQIELFEDGGIAARIDALRHKVTERFLDDNPNLRQKYNSFKEIDNADADSLRKG